MTTGNDLVSGALRIATSLSPGEAIPGQEADNALSILNSMLKAWSADSLMQPCRTLESFSIAQGVNSRTIGSGANLDTSRPDYITGAFWRDSLNQDYPIDVDMTKEEYNRIPIKTTAFRPTRLYYDPQFPNGIIYFDAATEAAYTLFLESLKPFNQFTTLQTSMSLPGEYEEAIKYLLVHRLAPEYGFEITPTIAALIDQAEARLLRKNFTMPPPQFDAGLRTRNPGWSLADFNAG